MINNNNHDAQKEFNTTQKKHSSQVQWKYKELIVH